MSETNLQQLERAVDALLARENTLTPERIRELIREIRVVPMFAISDIEAEMLARRLEARHDVTMRVGDALTERNYKPWLESVVADIEFYYWSRYRRLLEGKQLSARVISTLHQETDRTLGFLENPTKDGPWRRRGMVVGHVQSGKTANYIGLICKAADAGYRLVIVIAGIHNSLRNQTQKRMDEGFVGRDSARLLSQREDRYVGVGRIDNRRRPVTFTNSVKDFSKEMATSVGVPLRNLNEPVVFVIKKHPKTLTNLVDWLREHNASQGGRTVDVPMLVIDDEADNASINVAYGAGAVSRINGQIRELLHMFSRSCYVGYTATPFANIFIDPDTDDEMRGSDLFPRHFIVSLDPPSNYFGAERVFRDDPRSIIRHIDDNEDLLPLKHPTDHPVAGLPASMIASIRTFIVARAIRLTRDSRKEHMSMLVNASRFTRVQGQLRNLIQNLVDDIQASVRLNGALVASRALKDPEVAALYETWKIEFAGAGATWNQVQKELLASVAPIKVVEVNNRSHGTLNYDEYESTGLNVIAVGGYSLSRGLTLEGLMVSYFLRNSMMYDTLMQMGRWFGYRAGYDDLCRIWMPEEAEGWYLHVTESIEELREELRSMAAAGATPEEFGLKVRAHPDALIVTARNKMGSGERVAVNIGLKNRFVETAVLRNDEISLSANRRAARAFADELEKEGPALSSARLQSGGWFLSGVPARVVRGLIASFANHPGSLLTDPRPVNRYIEEREDSELAVWDLLVPSVSSTDEKRDSSLGIEVNCQFRTAGSRSDRDTLFITNKQRVSSRGIEKTGVSPEDIATAERDYRLDDPTRSSWNYPDRIYRAKRRRPLLILHLLRIAQDGVPHDAPVVAWSISFPDTQREERRVEYIVNPIWLRENFREEEDDEEMGEDDV